MAPRGVQRLNGAPNGYRDGSAVTPNDAAVLPDGPCTALIAQVAGNAAVTPAGGTPATYAASTGDVVFAVQAGDDTITRDAGDWLADGFRDGSIVEFTDTVSNNDVYIIGTVTALIITLAPGEVVVGETIAAATMNATGHPVIGLNAGEAVRLHTLKVWATGTTATGIVALYS